MAVQVRTLTCLQLVLDCISLLLPAGLAPLHMHVAHMPPAPTSARSLDSVRACRLLTTAAPYGGQACNSRSLQLGCGAVLL